MILSRGRPQLPRLFFSSLGVILSLPEGEAMPGAGNVQFQTSFVYDHIRLCSVYIVQFTCKYILIIYLIYLFIFTYSKLEEMNKC